MGMRVEAMDVDAVLGHEEVDCPVDLTDDQLLDCGRRLGKVLHEIALADDELKAAREAHKLAVKPLATAADALAQTLRTGQEWRPVACDLRLNADASRVETVRRDTGAVVTWRASTPQERQRELFRRGARGDVGASADAAG